MKKILSIVLAMMLILASFAAVAEEVDGATALIDNAITEGRNIAIDARITTADETNNLNGASVHIDGQLAGAPRLAVQANNAEGSLVDFMIGTDENRVYLRTSAMGEATYAVSKNTIMSMAQDLIKALGIDMGEVFATLMSIAEEADATTFAEVTPDLSNLDLTGMMPAVYTIMTKTTITDVEDYTMDNAALESEEPVEMAEEAAEEAAEEVAEAAEEAAEEVAEEAAEEAEEVEEEHNTIANPVAMIASITLDKDDLSIINNSIAATIKANADYAAVMNIDAMEVYDTIQAIIDSMTESLTIIINMDADGCPLYISACTSFGEEGNSATYVAQAYKTEEENITGYHFDVMAADDSSDVYNTLLTVNAAETEEDGTRNIALEALLGNNDYGFGVEVEYAGNDEAQYLAGSLVSYSNGEKTTIGGVVVNAALTVEGADFSAAGSVAVYAMPETNPDPVFAIELTVATTDPIIEDYSTAIILDNMDPAEEEAAQEEIAEDITESTEAIAGAVEDTEAAVTEEAPAEEAPAEEAAAEEAPAEETAA